MKTRTLILLVMSFFLFLKGQTSTAQRMQTTFNPRVHGFKFANDFKTETQIAGLNGPRFGGLCGGMVYASLDYYKRGQAIPEQNFRPAVGSVLQKYIYDRQANSTLLNVNGTSNADKWLELITNPFGWRSTEFFNWGLQGANGGRIQELRETMTTSNPVPLGLFKAGNGGVGPHHQVLAIGYDMGRYRGDLGNYKEDFKILIYDPNFPGQVMTMRVNPSGQYYYYEEAKSIQWQTYFVDRKHTVRNPPVIATPVLPADGLVRQLMLEIGTGGDDLRGGNDNVNVIVKYADGTSETYENINRRGRWINNYVETVPLVLRRSIALNKIKSVSLKTTFGGGIGGDNWNVDSFRIFAKEAGGEKVVFARNGGPLVRFDGNNTPYEAVLQH